MSIPSIADVESWNDPLYRVIAAQVLNLQRIEEGEVIGDHTIIGPAPSVIRLNDDPLRLQAKKKYEDATHILTLGPLNNAGDARITSRDDRIVEYLIVALIQLTRAEQVVEEEEEGEGSQLARRVDSFLHDFRAVFNDNDHLGYPGCRAGLLDHHTYNVTFDPEMQWPRAMAVIRCTGQMHAPR